MTTDRFDALHVDPASVAFGPGGAAKFHERAHVEDVDGDDDEDLVFYLGVESADKDGVDAAAGYF